MQSNMRLAFKLMGMALFTSFLCLFVQVSFHTMMKSFSTEIVGYKVYHVIDQKTGENEYLGIIDKSEKPQESEADMKYLSVYSEMSQSAKTVETVLSTIFSLGIFFCTTGTVFANAAAKDRNDCDFNGADPDKSRCLKIASLAAIVPTCFYVGIIACSFAAKNSVINWIYWVYRFVVMGPVKPINDMFTMIETDSFTVGEKVYTMLGPETNLANVPLGAILFHIAYIVLFLGYGYAMYRICYNEDSIIAKLLYKSTKKTKQPKRLGGR